MHLPSPTLLAIAFGTSEIALGLWRRADASTKSHDHHSLLTLWIVIGAAISGGFWLATAWPAMSWQPAPAAYLAGLAVFVAGLALRWCAIIYLGRFFTVDVAIAADHALVQGGPYRYLRHPSYSGALLAFLGLALCIGNAASLLLIVLATGIAFAWRIRIEERTLAGAFGARWVTYAAHTRRLIPGIY